MIKDLTSGNVGKELLRFAAPFMLSNALQTIYSLVDMVVVGQFVGASGLTAVSMGGQLTWLLCCIAIGYCTSGQIIIAQQVGAKNIDGVRHTIGTLFTVITAFSILFMILGIVFHAPLLVILNTPEEALVQAKQYTLICACGMFFVYGYNTVSAILRGMGDSTRPLLFIAIAAVLNILLDVILVGFVGMKAAGAALATVTSQAVSFIFSIVYLYQRKESFGFDFKIKSFAIHGPTFRSLTALGIPMTVQSSAINVSMLYVTAGINTYGLIYASVYSIGSKLQTIMFIITNSITSAAASMFGQCLGAGKKDRVKKIYWFGMLYCMVFLIFVAVACLTLPEAIFRIFTQDADVLAESAHFMVIQVVMFLGFATMTPGLALVNGTGNGSLGLITALLDGVILRIGLCLIMAAPLGVWGYFWGNALAGFVSTIIGGFYYFSGAWSRRKLMVDQEQE